MGYRGLVSRAEGKRWNNNASGWNVVRWELVSANPLGLFFLQPSRVDELEKFQVARASQSQTDESETRRRRLVFFFFTVLPGSHRKGLYR